MRRCPSTGPGGAEVDRRRNGRRNGVTAVRRLWVPPPAADGQLGVELAAVRLRTGGVWLRIGPIIGCLDAGVDSGVGLEQVQRFPPSRRSMGLLPANSKEAGP